MRGPIVASMRRTVHAAVHDGVVDTTGWGLPVRRVELRPGAALDPGEWPASVPAVASVLRGGLNLGAATVLVGENGSGKSTIVEGIAMAFGLAAESGTRNTMYSTRPSESPLSSALRLSRGPGASKQGFFLRAETMHGYFTHLEESGTGRLGDPAFHEMSHGESFVEVLGSRFEGPGLYLLDEPESALSFQSCLALVSVLADLAASGAAQVVVATHSPIVAALPGARLLQADEDGLRETTWEDLALVAHWRGFLDDPQRYLRHLLG